jgi:hypothetical protein
MNISAAPIRILAVDESGWEPARVYFPLTAREQRMRDESNRFQLTDCMTARGVIYARQSVRLATP